MIDRSPNADETSTRATFYSLANIVASCVADDADCDLLFRYATPRGRPAPTTVLEALANITRYPSNPWIRASDLFQLSFENPIYGPALGRDEEPTSWLEMMSRQAEGRRAAFIVDVEQYGEDIVHTHDATVDDPSTAFALSRLAHGPHGPTPLGIFRNVARPVYEADMEQQIADATAAKGPGDLAAVLRTNSTWTVS